MQELETQHSHTPHIHSCTVLVAEEHLGRQVVGRAAECVAGHVWRVHAPAEVCQSEVELAVQQKVLWLQVSVDHAQLFQEQQCTGQLVDVLQNITSFPTKK